MLETLGLDGGHGVANEPRPIILRDNISLLCPVVVAATIPASAAEHSQQPRRATRQKPPGSRAGHAPTNHPRRLRRDPMPGPAGEGQQHTATAPIAKPHRKHPQNKAAKTPPPAACFRHKLAAAGRGGPPRLQQARETHPNSSQTIRPQNERTRLRTQQEPLVLGLPRPLCSAVSDTAADAVLDGADALPVCSQAPTSSACNCKEHRHEAACPRPTRATACHNQSLAICIALLPPQQQTPVTSPKASSRKGESKPQTACKHGSALAPPHTPPIPVQTGRPRTGWRRRPPQEGTQSATQRHLEQRPTTFPTAALAALTTAPQHFHCSGYTSTGHQQFRQRACRSADDTPLEPNRNLDEASYADKLSRPPLT